MLSVKFEMMQHKFNIFIMGEKKMKLPLFSLNVPDCGDFCKKHNGLLNRYWNYLTQICLVLNIF